MGTKKQNSVQQNTTLKLVLLESPYAGKTPEETQRNVEYARAAMADCFKRGEAPYASHLLYTQPGVLDDNIPEERSLGIEAGLLWGAKAEKTVVYSDLGVSKGMALGIGRAAKEGRPCETRKLGGKWSQKKKKEEAPPEESKLKQEFLKLLKEDKEFRRDFIDEFFKDIHLDFMGNLSGTEIKGYLYQNGDDQWQSTTLTEATFDLPEIPEGCGGCGCGGCGCG